MSFNVTETSVRRSIILLTPIEIA